MHINVSLQIEQSNFLSHVHLLGYQNIFVAYLSDLPLRHPKKQVAFTGRGLANRTLARPDVCHSSRCPPRVQCSVRLLSVCLFVDAKQEHIMLDSEIAVRMSFSKPVSLSIGIENPSPIISANSIAPDTKNI